MFKVNKKKKIEAETCPQFRSQYFEVRKNIDSSYPSGPFYPKLRLSLSLATPQGLKLLYPVAIKNHVSQSGTHDYQFNKIVKVLFTCPRTMDIS